MKKNLFITIPIILLAGLMISLSENTFVKESEGFAKEIERWNNLNRDSITETIKNADGQILKSITITKTDISQLLAQDDNDKVVFNIAVDANGAFSFIMNTGISSRQHSFKSQLGQLENLLGTFDQELYREKHVQMNPNALEHLIDLQPALTEIERWENVNDQKLVDAFFVGDVRIRSLSYNKEVLEELIKQEELNTVTAFLALNDQGRISLVTVGRDSSGHLMLPSTIGTNSYTNYIFNFVGACPPACPPPRCTSNSQCGAGTECRDGRCRPIRTD